jgi:exosome complex exonuclease RRP6
LTSHSVTVVDYKTELEQMINDLQSNRVLFIDCRDHKFRSYLGFICWILILTEDNKLYAVDGIKLRSHLIELMKITLDPTILKLVPDSVDITAFQRDFGLYLVNVIQLKIETQPESNVASEMNIRR